MSVLIAESIEAFVNENEERTYLRQMIRTQEWFTMYWWKNVVSIKIKTRKKYANKIAEKLCKRSLYLPFA